MQPELHNCVTILDHACFPPFYITERKTEIPLALQNCIPPDEGLETTACKYILKRCAGKNASTSTLIYQDKLSDCMHNSGAGMHQNQAG